MLVSKSDKCMKPTPCTIDRPAPNIAAKPTWYKGVHFRSKLESEWAQLFDFLEIQWVYEKEPFVLDSGCYLPDFWFPEFSKWGEVKPGLLGDVAKRKLMELTSKTGYDSILFEGKPRLGLFRKFQVCFDGRNTLYKSVGWSSFLLG